MHILIAPNAFKNSLTASAAAHAIEKGLMKSTLKCTMECFPIADGGDGTGELLIKKLGGITISKEVNDPMGRKIKASFGLIDNRRTAVIEMASATGIRLLNENELDPVHASSFGTGELVKFALDEGVNNILVGMGGSATVDGGTGILKALGARFLNSSNVEISGLPESFHELSTIDINGIDKRIYQCAITILCDVDNKLLGPLGAAIVFGPQKGADKQAIIKLEAFLAKIRNIGLIETGKDMSDIKYGGTAGGAAAGLSVFIKAHLVNGADHFLKLTGFENSLKRSNLVITGEGNIDKQTLQGKGPFAVANLAKKMKLPVIGIAGKIPGNENKELMYYFDVLMSIASGPGDISAAIQLTEANLERTACSIGNLLAIK